jgi:hypothetical protein
MKHIISGKYGHVRTNTGDFNETYWTNVSTRSNTVHCLDFFYYLTDAFNEAKISFGWQSNETTTTIVELTALSENRWQRSQTTYMSPLSEMNQVSDLYKIIQYLSHLSLDILLDLVQNDA